MRVGSYSCDWSVDMVVQAEDVPAGVARRDLEANTSAAGLHRHELTARLPEPQPTERRKNKLTQESECCLHESKKLHLSVHILII